MNLFLYSLFVASQFPLLLGPRPISLTANALGGASVMPKQCRLSKTSPASHAWHWRPDTLVKVYYLKNHFNGGEVDAFSRSISNWNSALREINSHIVFVVGGERESIATDDSSVTVMRGIPRGKERLGEVKLYSMSNGVERIIMIINPIVTDSSALTSLMTHELGHSLGLADCYSCRRGTTTMAAFKDVNKGNDVYAPSVCDKYVVAAGYTDQVSIVPSN